MLRSPHRPAIFAAAEEKWIRAGEIRGYDGETLRALALVALKSDRPLTARQHVENALIVNPSDAEAHAILDELDRQSELRFTEAGTRRDDPDPEKKP